MQCTWRISYEPLILDLRRASTVCIGLLLEARKNKEAPMQINALRSPIVA